MLKHTRINVEFLKSEKMKVFLFIVKKFINKGQTAFCIISEIENLFLSVYYVKFRVIKNLIYMTIIKYSLENLKMS